MTVDCRNQYATIAVSSLNNDLDIGKTDSMLLTAVGVVENTDMKMSLAPESVQKYNGYAPYMQMDDFGKAPIICEVIEADISIQTDRTDLYVDAINAEGYSVGRVPVTFEDGYMRFTIGKTNPSIYYLIQAE